MLKSNYMIKYLFTSVTWFLMLVGVIVNGQSFGVKSFDGRNRAINVLSHDIARTLIISSLTDTITIKDFNGLTGEIKVLNKSFLRIDYRVRAGTGMDLKRTIILCVSGRHLIQSLDVTSFFKEEFIDFSKPVDTANLVDVKTVYALQLNLKDDVQRHYILHIKIHDTRRSKSEPKTNYAHDSEVDLSYDSTRNIFYSTHKKTSRYFTIYDPKTGKDRKRYIRGTFPAVKLGEYEYYLIKNVWYEKNRYGDLTRYSY